MAHSNLDAIVAEIEEAFEKDYKPKALAAILEAHTGERFSQEMSVKILNAVQDYIVMTTYITGQARLNRLGKFDLIEVGEKKGKIKVTGEEKEWITPAHTTLKFKVNDATKDIVSTEGENHIDGVFKALLSNV